MKLSCSRWFGAKMRIGVVTLRTFRTVGHSRHRLQGVKKGVQVSLTLILAVVIKRALAGRQNNVELVYAVKQYDYTIILTS